MSIMEENTIRKATTQWVSKLNAVFTREMSTHESNTLIRAVFATFLLLRRANQQEAELDAIAAVENIPYCPVLPHSLQWSRLSSMNEWDITERLHQLANYADSLKSSTTFSTATYVQALAEPLRSILKVNFAYLIDVVRWIEGLPFETPSERHSLLEVFDQVVAETKDAYDGQYSTPVNIARLVVALANPQPGESIYDPCFGSGNFLVAAWQHAENSHTEEPKSNALIDISGIEINTGAYLVGLTRMLLAGIAEPRLDQGNSLEREPHSKLIHQGFDVVLANPPIGVKTNREQWRYEHFAIPTNDSTGLFIQLALERLGPNGRAVIVVPESFLFRSGAERELRRYLLEQGLVEAVIGLPVGVFAPYTGVKGSLLILRKQGGNTRVRMADASPLFEPRSGRKAPFIRAALSELLAQEIQRAELRPPRELPPGLQEGTPGTGVLTRSIWEVSIDELAATEWDLSPRRREKGGLNELLNNLHEVLGKTCLVRPLSEVAEVTAGRSIKASDLLNAPPSNRAVGYVRIKNLSQGKVGRVSSWLRPEIADTERRWALLPGDVLVSKSGTIGKTALVRNSTMGSVAANGLYVLRTNSELLDAGFLLAYLASHACQNWLTAHSRGIVIQHLNRAVLDELPVPLPTLSMQARAAAQFREFGSDALEFLAQAMGGSESDRLTIWLAELDSKVPKAGLGLDDPSTLSQFEPIAEQASVAQRWLGQEQQVSDQAARWLTPLTQALLHLVGVSQIPAGPSLLNVLQEAERSIQATLEQATGHLPAESQVRSIAERLRDWLRTTVANLTDTEGLQVRSAPVLLVAGDFAEFSVELENPSSLPLRNVRVETRPDWGMTERQYLSEHGSLSLQLRGNVPKHGENLSMHIFWQGRNLMGQVVEGEIELAIRVADAAIERESLAFELGHSPYVTGSPLEPLHGHNVFYGREELIDKIRRQIATNGNVVLLEGNRRTGKTSILKHMEGKTVTPGWLAVYSSLQGAEGASQCAGVPTPEVFREIARSIATALGKLSIEVPLPNGQIIAAGKPALGIARACRDGIGVESPFADFRDYLERVLNTLEQQSLGLVLMLDEFDKLQEGIDNRVTSPQVPENIRFLIQTYPKFSAILTGSRRLKRLREEYWSALYGLGTSIPVTALDVDSARKVVTEPVRDQLIFSQEAVDKVLSVTARHPYLMQCLCNRVFDYAVQTKNQSITASVVAKAAQWLVRDNEHFASLWDYAGQGPEKGRNRRQFILSLCARSLKQGTHVGFGPLHEMLTQSGVDVAEDVLDADLTYLRELELVEFSGEIGDGEYRLTIPLMADWIEQQQDAVVVASRARTEAEEENA
ncbi:N-6 DNA methylase [Aeromonas salmonicida]|uniref:N-6 DNA methylase n=1 Tax=Aeromonas salmonicida TaxID=645 RepID=UPI00240D66AE|nr:N-6 DNA methylase [Aeromonas salmonicida]WFC14691.1 N-6 DNA methylase [Aeromonas salmonicida]